MLSPAAQRRCPRIVAHGAHAKEWAAPRNSWSISTLYMLMCPPAFVHPPYTPRQDRLYLHRRYESDRWRSLGLLGSRLPDTTSAMAIRTRAGS